MKRGSSEEGKRWSEKVSASWPRPPVVSQMKGIKVVPIPSAMSLYLLTYCSFAYY